MILDILYTRYTIILAAAIVHYVLGMLWYSPAIFGKAWKRALDFKKTELEIERQKRKWKPYIAGFLTSLVMVYILSVFIKLAEVTTILGGMHIALLIWLGFIATTSMDGLLWNKKPTEVYLIDAAYYLISMNIVGIILAITA